MAHHLPGKGHWPQYLFDVVEADDGESELESVRRRTEGLPCMLANWHTLANVVRMLTDQCVVAQRTHWMRAHWDPSMCPKTSGAGALSLLAATQTVALPTTTSAVTAAARAGPHAAP